MTRVLSCFSQSSHEDWADRYGLIGPVAGNFFRNYYTEQYTNGMFCYFSKCTGAPYPFPIEGVTDQEECQPE